MKTVDARGMACPKPLIMAKKALNGLDDGGRVTLLVDNETSKQNVERFCRDNGVGVSVSKNGTVFELVLSKRGTKAIAASEEAYCTPDSSKKQQVVVFRSSTMGNGPEEL
jgi:TusA-related sulfurtransferase